jgi:hypothetical protein
MKIILLLIRLYYWLIPIYVGASLFTLFNFYVGYKVYRTYSISVTSQLTVPV